MVSVLFPQYLHLVLLGFVHPMAEKRDPMSTPVVSVLVPVYNVERYLEECLESLVAQTFQDFEAIIINDGSTDGSRAIIQAFLDRDSRFRAIDKSNSGYGASMNRGLDEARGTYVSILESDDVMVPEGLQVLVDAACVTDAQVVKGDFEYYWSSPERHERAAIVESDWPEGVHNARELTQLFALPASIWSGLYLRDFLRKERIRFLETPGASYQDTSFAYKVWACAERVAFVDHVIIRYRQDNENSSVKSPEKVFCVCDEHDEVTRFLDEDPGRFEDVRGAVAYAKFLNYLWNYDRLAPEVRGEYRNRIADELHRDWVEGRIDFSCFAPWAQADFLELTKSPDDYDARRSANFQGKGAAAILSRYLRVGGPRLLGKALRERFSEGF
ncbi:glycosyltransferase [Olsenella sp. YH-ols2217]|uniref:Glycosyltransferase n=1 Tax=Kribbibacterium absianum TaxID=3044210 RepID=A0ABT6ZM73_9ACTN|nr:MULTISPECIES: glycosyltransferase [unclassified Olsenella]MDJ1122154.1 glycosyltransferase [Olsenella sp. YH-ols2216]MDJ1130162.1 glycosyltransferase [Olsenella sp. YH-ols2217]